MDRARYAFGGLVFVEGGSSRPVNYDPVTGIIEWQVDSAEGAVEWTYQVEPRDDLAPGTHPMQSRVQATMGNVTVQSEAVTFTAVVAYFEIAITVDQPTIELGDFVRYDLDLANLSSHDSLAVLLVRMQIPEGFTYVNGTSLFEGQEVTTLEESGYRQRQARASGYVGRLDLAARAVNRTCQYAAQLGETAARMVPARHVPGR